MERIYSRWQVQLSMLACIWTLLSGPVCAHITKDDSQQVLPDAHQRIEASTGWRSYEPRVLPPYARADRISIETSVLHLIGGAASGVPIGARRADAESVVFRKEDDRAWGLGSDDPQSFDELLDYLMPLWISRRGQMEQEIASHELVSFGSSATAAKRDALLTAFVGIGLVAYQLSRKQRSLRSSPFAP